MSNLKKDIIAAAAMLTVAFLLVFIASLLVP